MSDKPRDQAKPSPTDKPAEKKDADTPPAASGFAASALIAAIGGAMLLGAFFLPLYTFKPDKAKELNDQIAEALRNLEQRQKDLTDLRHRHPGAATVAPTDIGGVERFYRGDERLSPENLEALKHALATFGDFITSPTLLQLFSASGSTRRFAASQNSTGALATAIRVFGVAQVLFLAPLVLGVLVLLVVFIGRFRPFMGVFLILFFVGGLVVSAVFGVAELFTLLWQNADAYKESAKSYLQARELYEIEDIPYVLGLGTHLLVAGGLLITFATLIGTRPGNRGVCFTAYLVIVIGIAVAAYLGLHQVITFALYKAEIPNRDSPRVPCATCGDPTPHCVEMLL